MIISVVLVAALAAAPASALDTRALEDQLAADAAAFVDAPRSRPVHRGEPLAGALGDVLGSRHPGIEALSDPQGADARFWTRLSAVARGDQPAGALSTADRDRIAALDGELDDVLAGARRERADLPLDGDALGARWRSKAYTASVLAAVRARLAAAAGDPARALDACVDGLGLARDTALAPVAIGNAMAHGIAQRLAPACAAALDGAPPAARGAALPALRRIRAAYPALAAIYRADVVATELIRFGPLAGPRFADRLGPRSRHLLALGERLAREPDALPRPEDWPAARAERDALVAAAALEPAERDRALLAAARPSTPPGTDPTRAVLAGPHAHDATLARLDALALAADALAFRDRHRRWPASAAELVATAPADAAERRAAPRARLIRDEERLRLVLPLPEDPVDATAPVELEFVLHGAAAR